MLVSFFTYVECCFCYVRSSKIFSLATVVGDGDTWGFEDKNGTVKCEADPFSTPAYFNFAGKATALGVIVERTVVDSVTRRLLRYCMKSLRYGTCLRVFRNFAFALENQLKQRQRIYLSAAGPRTGSSRKTLSNTKLARREGSLCHVWQP